MKRLFAFSAVLVVLMLTLGLGSINAKATDGALSVSLNQGSPPAAVFTSTMAAKAANRDALGYNMTLTAIDAWLAADSAGLNNNRTQTTADPAALNGNSLRISIANLTLATDDMTAMRANTKDAQTKDVAREVAFTFIGNSTNNAINMTASSIANYTRHNVTIASMRGFTNLHVATQPDSRLVAAG